MREAVDEWPLQAVGRARYVGLRYNLEGLERVGAPVGGGLVGAREKLRHIGGADYYGTVPLSATTTGTTPHEPRS